MESLTCLSVSQHGLSNGKKNVGYLAFDTCHIGTYDDLYEWSVHSIEDFWSTVWDFTNIISSSKGNQVLDTSVPMDGIPEWFKGAKLNWAENSLWCRSSEKIAIIATGKENEPIA